MKKHSIQIKDADKKIWKNIKQTIPKKIFDFHVHSFHRKGFKNGIPDSLKFYLPCDTQIVLNNLHSVFPEREVSAIVMGWPNISADILKQNNYIASSSEKLGTFFLALISPQTDINYIKKIVKNNRCVGFKPYKCFAKNPEDARITDFLNQQQMEIAQENNLIITLHLSKKGGISDPVNIEDLIHLAEKYPSILWNLAHCGRSFIPDYIEKSLEKLKPLKKFNIYFDTSAVTDSEVFTLFFSFFGSDKILYGSDAPISFLHGRCVGFGYEWAFITEETHSISASFPVFPVLILYEQIKAMNKAFRKSDFSKADIKRVFYENSKKIVQNIIRGKK